MRILISGAESSGKTTLASQLSTALGFSLISEYAREYLNEFGPNYEKKHLLQIAERNWENYIASPDSAIFDTYLLNMKIWSEYKYGFADPWMDEHIKKSKFDLVFLLMYDIKWEYDPLRENENDRQFLFEEYKRQFHEYGLQYHIIQGDRASRFKECMRIISSHKSR